MRPNSIGRSVLAVGISFWIAAAACLFGCLPMFAHTANPTSSLCKVDSPQSQGADCCHHENQSAPADKDQPSPSASCCPTDATLAPVHKQTVTLAAAFTLAAIPESPLALAISSGSLGAVQAFGTGGRDTLRKVHVLRI